MKKAMTNITVFSMIALPLLMVGWLVYPFAYVEHGETKRVEQTVYIGGLQAVSEYQNTCTELEYSCNEDLIRHVQSNASKRSWDAQASSTSLLDVFQGLW